MKHSIKATVLKKGALLCALFCVAFTLCAAPKAKNETAQERTVIKTQRGDIYRYALKNGIPVYVKPNPTNSAEGIGIVVSGGTAYLTPELSGLESTVFGMMTQSSAKYSLAKRQAIQYEKMASISNFSNHNGSVLFLSCLSHYFDDMLPILIDGFLKPSFKKDEYDLAMLNANQYIVAMMNDPASSLQYNAEALAYQGHPYATRVEPTVESLPNITQESLKQYHKTLLDARRISIVAVGNMDGEKLVAKLNTLLGKIPALATPLKSLDVPPLTVTGEPFLSVHPSASGTAFIARAFALPANSSDEFEKVCLASSMFSETLFNIVRTKYGACYSPSSNVVGSAASYGFEFIYRASDFENIASYMAEARSIMAQGKLIDSVNADGSYNFVPIGARIDAFKNSSINGFYQSFQTSLDILVYLTRSILNYNDIAEIYTFEPKTRAVTVDDIQTVFKKYWIDGSSRWFAVTGPDEYTKLKLE